MAELESIHEEKVAIIRRSFKQQLSDALMSLSSQNASDMLHKNMKPKEEKKKAGKDKTLEFQLQNEQLQKELDDLKNDVELLQQENEELRRLLEEQANEPKITQEDIDKLEDQLAKEREKIRDLEDQISRAAGDTDTLKATITQLNEKVDLILTEKSQLEEVIESLKNQIEEEKDKMRITVEKMQADFEAQKAAELEKAKAEAIENARKEFEEQRRLEKEQFEKLKAERDELERTFRAQLEARDKEHAQALSKLKRSEKAVKVQLERLKKELEYNEKAWSKRLQILQDSNQAIREEVQTRTSMRKHVLKLKHAEVMYRTDDPQYYLPAPSVLPEITAPLMGGMGSRVPTKERGRVTFQEDAESVTLSYSSQDNQQAGILGGELMDENQLELDNNSIKILQEYHYLPEQPMVGEENE